MRDRSYRIDRPHAPSAKAYRGTFNDTPRGQALIAPCDPSTPSKRAGLEGVEDRVMFVVGSAHANKAPQGGP